MTAKAVWLSESHQQDIQIRISQHALRRAKKRLHWEKNAILRMANRALLRGITPNIATGSIRLSLLSIVYPGSFSCPYLYGEHIYIFAHDSVSREVVLLTIYRAASDLLRSILNRSNRKGSSLKCGAN
jgi:hypothetical protein